MPEDLGFVTASLQATMALLDDEQGYRTASATWSRSDGTLITISLSIGEADEKEDYE